MLLQLSATDGNSHKDMSDDDFTASVFNFSRSHKEHNRIWKEGVAAMSFVWDAVMAARKAAIRRRDTS